ncbi:unnamed protein product [Fraxinus pennsylvanica]|uniref:Uncharacterized protein n=1 Tax=Fraxinus pennsylvanica TaxID=56036 RepID=A0AAD2AF28_9LAMI|nr:unnamed protein product [Fraxinus pennsylvanica]
MDNTQVANESITTLKIFENLSVQSSTRWQRIYPSLYLSPFLGVIQSDDIPTTATTVVLQSVLKILRLGIFDERTIRAKDVINSTMTAITDCCLERTNSDFTGHDCYYERLGFSFAH